MIIDAHAHLWKKQAGIVNGKPVYDIGGGKSDFGGEIKQMMPAYMTDGENNVESILFSPNVVEKSKLHYSH